jgi:hypothetical protein
VRRLLLPSLLFATLAVVPAHAAAAGPAKAEGGNADEGNGKDKDKDKRGKKLRERAQGNVGLGVLVGNPLALSVKLFVAPKHALSFAAGYAWLMSPEDAGRKGTYRLHIDYAWHPGAIASNQVMDLLPYVGVGIGSGFFVARIPAPSGTASHLRARPISFLRLPVLGLTFHWQRVPMDTAIEASWTPAMIWIPHPHGDVKFADFGVAIRYYF